MPPSLQKTIPADEPPMFLAAATDGQLGLNTHSVDLYTKWTATKHSAELHIYAKGGHGLGMGKHDLPADHWIDRFGDWQQQQGFLKRLKRQLPIKSVTRLTIVFRRVFFCLKCRL